MFICSFSLKFSCSGRARSPCRSRRFPCQCPRPARPSRAPRSLRANAHVSDGGSRTRMGRTRLFSKRQRASAPSEKQQGPLFFSRIQKQQNRAVVPFVRKKSLFWRRLKIAHTRSGRTFATEAGPRDAVDHLRPTYYSRAGCGRSSRGTRALRFRLRARARPTLRERDAVRTCLMYDFILEPKYCGCSNVRYSRSVFCERSLCLFPDLCALPEIISEELSQLDAGSNDVKEYHGGARRKAPRPRPATTVPELFGVNLPLLSLTILTYRDIGE